MSKAMIVDRNTKNGWTDVHTPAESIHELYMKAQDQINNHRKICAHLYKKREEYTSKSKLKGINQQISRHQLAINDIRRKRDSYLPSKDRVLIEVIKSRVDKDTFITWASIATNNYNELKKQVQGFFDG